MRATVVAFGPVEEKVRRQLERCAEQAIVGVLCADAHYGYSQPVGAAVAYRDYISPSGVGYDIACGNKAVKTSLQCDGWEPSHVAKIMDEIVSTISFGVGRNNNERVESPVVSEIAGHHMPEIRKMGWMAEGQLGTVGAGNHYVDLFRDEDGWLWIGVHFGSRGFGHHSARGFLNLAVGRKWDERVGDAMDAPATLLKIGTPLADDYLSVMEIAGRYACAGRDWVCDRVSQILGTEITDAVHNHHNFAWKETHNGEDMWVVRKGCTPAFPGQRSFIGATMGEPAYIIEGIDSDEARAALFSTVHGAGRAMSRNEAAGKKKWVRDPKTGKKHPMRIGGGKINWEDTLAFLREQRIVLRGGAADEAPGAYKRLEEVLAYHAGTVRIVHQLIPIGVAMAGDEIEDPYKD
jgi:tRNA-splicing ligase RtcB (3'-phosphate/5'-hydroxy nucleic acid ligase)